MVIYKQMNVKMIGFKDEKIKFIKKTKICLIGLIFC